MTGPDRIWILPTHGAREPDDYFLLHPDYRNGRGSEYIRRDPAVLAALPEVQAMIAAAYEAAARACDAKHAEYILGKGHAPEKYDSHFSQLARKVRALTTSDATAALARIVREAEARGMERAAARARVYASNYEQSSDGRNTFILLAEWADAEAAAILARAAEIERDGK